MRYHDDGKEVLPKAHEQLNTLIFRQAVIDLRRRIVRMSPRPMNAMAESNTLLMLMSRSSRKPTHVASR